MKVGTIMEPLNSYYDEETVLRMIAEAGFDSVDYSLIRNYKDAMWQLSDDELRQEMEAVKAKADKYGLMIGQTHSPFQGDWIHCPETKEARWNAQVQAIKATAYLGSPYTVIHPLKPQGRITDKGYYEYAKELNMEYYRFLEPYLREYNVKGAIENLFTNDSILVRTAKTSCSTAEALIDYIDTLASEQFVACLDVGHAVLCGEDPVQMIYKLGRKYLHVTHVHDNDYLNDDHYMPGIGKIDWYAIGRALNDIGYQGLFNFEANRTFERIVPFRIELTVDFLKVYIEMARAITNVK